VGAWGTRIFESDIAMDVRGAWRDAILDGLDAKTATERLNAAFEDAREDVEDGPVFCLALAAAQMETGRLLPDVRDRALDLIDAGGDVQRWAEEDEALGRRRRRVLDRLAEKLRGPQPQPKRIRRPRSYAVPFDVGDVVRVRAPDGSAEALLLVVGHEEEGFPGRRDPVLATLLWDGGAVPAREQLEQLPVLLTDEPGGRTRLRPDLTVATTHRKDSVFGPHLGEVVAKGIEPPALPDHHDGALWRGSVVTGWTEWPNVARWVGGPAFRRQLELTRTERESGRSR
jgi:hypothetical protein